MTFVFIKDLVRKIYCRPIRKEKLILFIRVFLNIPIKYSNKNK